MLCLLIERPQQLQLPINGTEPNIVGAYSAVEDIVEKTAVV
jgi:hypothetical protein